jgi:hypothetical protein
LDYEFSDIEKYKTTVSSDDLIQTQFSKANPITRSFLLLSAQSSPLDLTNGRIVDLGTSLSSFNRKQYHHVFPNSFLSKKGEKKEKRFTVVNFCFLPADSNKKISSKSPSDYFENVIPSANRTDILNSNLLPVDADIYSKDDFDAFLEKRSSLLLLAISNLAEG